MEIPDDSKAERMAHLLRLLNAASAGTLDALECPRCRQDAVSVWFTHPGDGIYRTWFICTDARSSSVHKTWASHRTTPKIEFLSNWKTTMSVRLQARALRDPSTRR